MIRLPSPTRQEFVDKAYVVDEFKGFLRHSLKSGVNRHLLINLQDRTSWKEHSRCLVIEELQLQAEFGQSLIVVTLAVDTEFFYQLPPYYDLNDSLAFISHFKEHLLSDGTGFYFPKAIKEFLFSGGIDTMLAAVHSVVFDNCKTLDRKERLAFIDFFYLILEVKLLDILQPDTFSLTCKDAIDVGMTSSALLFIFLKMAQEEEMSEEEFQQLNTMLFVPALLIRERPVLEERFNRMLNVVKVFQERLCKSKKGRFLKSKKKELELLFDSDILSSDIQVPTSEERN
jgi:hypothetical protein